MLEIGQDFAHFRILRKMGEGGMGAVYLAEDQKLNRRVALKVLLSDYFDNAEHQERFRREAKTAAQVSHPNVMAIYDIGAAIESASRRELGYIVMEYVEGESLTSYAKSRSLELASILRLAEKISSGLAAAHKLGIVHRDIKPDNVFIKDDGEPKILDFGLAKPVGPGFPGDKVDATDTVSQELTKAGKILGTVSYMSPEQARGEPVDTRSDIFSFGILLYRLATGELPFSGESQVSTLARILETRHESPRLKNEDIPAELERIIDKCLQKDPDDRYQDTRDLVVDLRSLRRQYDSGVSDSVSAIVDRPARVKKTYEFKFGWKQLVLALFALSLLFAVVMEFIDSSDTGVVPSVEARGNSLAILGFDNKTGDPELGWLETGLPEILLTDLAQSEALSLVSRERVIDCLPEEKRSSHTFEECVRAAKSLGVNHLLSGSFYRLGDKIRIDARLQDAATGNVVLGLKVIGEDPFTLVDSLTEKIAASLNIQLEKGEDRQVATYTSSSPEAFKHYQAGMDKMLAELFDEAIEEFNKAIAIDSTFALPYMRIGMSHVFDSRPQQGAEYFARARKYESKLPVRDRHLLEVYASLWLDQQFDKAFTEMESFVKRYPDDKEGRTIYGALVADITRDTVAAFAHLDTALQLDPTYQLALSQLAWIHGRHSNYDRAIEFARRIRRYHPESPEPYLRLGRLYTVQREYDKAIAEYDDLLSKVPDHPVALSRLSGLYVRKRDFGSALGYLELLKDSHMDDPFWMYRYCWNRANLAVWAGEFKQGMDYQFKACDEALKTGDSAYVYSSLETISSYCRRYGNIDSALYYLEQSDDWANVFQKLNWPIELVSIDPGRVSEARPIFEKAARDLRSRLPSEMWHLADILENMFEAHADADTAALIDAYTYLVEQSQEEIGTIWQLGVLMIADGRFEEGKKVMRRIVDGDRETISAYLYLTGLYYLGIAEEGLGNTGEAVSYYRRVLKYWDDADIEIKEVKDARLRLARLTS